MSSSPFSTGLVCVGILLAVLLVIAINELGMRLINRPTPYDWQRECDFPITWPPTNDVAEPVFVRRDRYVAEMPAIPISVLTPGMARR